MGGDALVADASERLLLTANPVQAKRSAGYGKVKRRRSAERCTLTRSPPYA